MSLLSFFFDGFDFMLVYWIFKEGICAKLNCAHNWEVIRIEYIDNVQKIVCDNYTKKVMHGILFFRLITGICVVIYSYCLSYWEPNVNDFEISPKVFLIHHVFSILEFYSFFHSVYMCTPLSFLISYPSIPVLNLVSSSYPCRVAFLNSMKALSTMLHFSLAFLIHPILAIFLIPCLSDVRFSKTFSSHPRPVMHQSSNSSIVQFYINMFAKYVIVKMKC